MIKLEKILNEKIDIKNLVSFFINISNNKEIFLPIDPDGSFTVIKTTENQVLFNLILYLPNLDMVYTKGWISKDKLKGEIFCHFMPYIDLSFFKNLKNKLEKRFRGMKLYSQYLKYPNIRSIDGFF